MDFFLIANFSRENVPTVTWDVCRELAARGCGVFAVPVPGAFYPPNVQVINMESACAHTDMILCIAGAGHQCWQVGLFGPGGTGRCCQGV